MSRNAQLIGAILSHFDQNRRRFVRGQKNFPWHLGTGEGRDDHDTEEKGSKIVGA